MWRVEYDPAERLLRLQLAENVDVRQMRSLAKAHSRALEATGGERFRVLLDLRRLIPLDDESAAVLNDVKRVAATLPGYAGRAVLVDSPTIAMQQRRATLEDGGDGGEVITSDSIEARSFLERL